MTSVLTFSNKPEIGHGIYSIPDVAMILSLPYSKVNSWLKRFWDEKIGRKYNSSYSWTVDMTKAVNFYTLIEIYSFYRLSEAGVKPRKILEAHEILSTDFNTLYPFATKEILSRLKTDGQLVLLQQEDGTFFSLDNTRQFKLEFIKDFFKNLDFDDNALAQRFWPLGKEKSIVCDPQFKFGHPIIFGTNINPESLFELEKAGEPVSFIAELYDLKESQVKDAVEFCKNAA